MPNWAVTFIHMTGPRDARMAFMSDPEGPGAVHNPGSGSTFSPGNMWESGDGWWTHVWSAWEHDLGWIDRMGRRHSEGMRMLFFWEEPENDHIAHLRIYEGGDLVRAEDVDADARRDEFPTPRAWAQAMFDLVSDGWGVGEWNSFEIDTAPLRPHQEKFPDIPWDEVDEWRATQEEIWEKEQEAKIAAERSDRGALVEAARQELAENPLPDVPVLAPARPEVDVPAVPCAHHGVYLCEADTWALLSAYREGYGALSGEESEVRPEWMAPGDEPWRAGIDAARAAMRDQGIEPQFAQDGAGRWRPADVATEWWYLKQLASLGVGMPDGDDGPVYASEGTPAAELRRRLLEGALTCVLQEEEDGELIDVARGWWRSGFVHRTQDLGVDAAPLWSIEVTPRGYARLLEGHCRACGARPADAARWDLRGTGSDEAWVQRTEMLAAERERPIEERIDLPSLFPPGQARRAAGYFFASNSTRINYAQTLREARRSWVYRDIDPALMGVDPDIFTRYLDAIAGWNLFIPDCDHFAVRGDGAEARGEVILRRVIESWSGDRAVTWRTDFEEEVLWWMVIYYESIIDPFRDAEWRSGAQVMLDAFIARWAREGLMEPVGPSAPGRWAVTEAAHLPTVDAYGAGD